jgi:hypothetical protein
MALTFWKSKYWAPCGVAIVAFAAGLFTAGRLSHLNEVRADSNRVFELRIYHALPGKLPAMESRFRDTTSKLLVKHDLNVIGYWIPDSKSPAWDNTFVFLLAHSGREEAEKNWREMAAAPFFKRSLHPSRRRDYWTRRI